MYVTGLKKIGCIGECKMMFIDSPCNVNNLTCDVPVVANTKPLVRTATQMCLGTKLDENLYWHSHIEMICKKLVHEIAL